MLALPILNIFTPPDLSLRQPLTGAAFFPFYLSYYAMAVLVILPHTFILKLSLLPFVLWQAWRCAVGLNLSVTLALSLGIENGERLNHWNLVYVVRWRYCCLHINPCACLLTLPVSLATIDWCSRHDITIDGVGINEKAVEEIRTFGRGSTHSR